MGTSDPRTPAAVRRPGGRSLNSVVLQLAAFALTFIVVAGLVVTSSRAAFVAQNDNSSNQITAATIDLADDDASAAMFANVTGLVPGTNLQRCIAVTYTGTVDPLPVQIYATSAPTGTLAPYLDLTIDVAADNADAFGTCTNFGVPGGSTNVYSGTLGTFASAHSNYATSRSAGFDPSGTGQTRVYRFTISVQDNALAEGLTSTFGFSWETRTS